MGYNGSSEQTTTGAARPPERTTMQASLFTESNMVKTPPPAKKRKRRAKKKAQRVVRGKGLKRHPSRPPVKKRVVKTKKVAMQGHEDGPLGEIMDRDGDTLYVQWPGKNRLYSHNARYMVSVDSKDEE